MSTQERVVVFEERDSEGQNAVNRIKEMGFEAFALRGDDNALEHLSDVHPDLVLYRVSDFDDGNVFARLRERTDADEIPMMVFSDDSNGDIAERFYGLGADDIISGTLPESVFRAKLHNCIKHKRNHENEKHRIEELEKSLQFRTILMRMASHDLRNPLGIILGYLDMLEPSISKSGTVSDRDMERLRKIRKAALRMQQLISTFLNYQKIKLDSVELNLTNGSIAAIARELFDDINKSAVERGIEMSYEEDPDVPAFRIDKDCLREGISALFDNAFKSCSSGESIAVKVKHSDDNVRLEVQDWGMPLPDDIRDNLFYVPLDTSKAPSGERKFQFEMFLLDCIVKAHGGKTGVEFPGGDSTLIWFEIPSC